MRPARKQQCWLTFAASSLESDASSPTVANALRSEDAKVREKALDELLGLDLRNRHLREANFFDSVTNNRGNRDSLTRG